MIDPSDILQSCWYPWNWNPNSSTNNHINREDTDKIHVYISNSIYAKTASMPKVRGRILHMLWKLPFTWKEFKHQPSLFSYILNPMYFLEVTTYDIFLNFICVRYYPHLLKSWYKNTVTESYHMMQRVSELYNVPLNIITVLSQHHDKKAGDSIEKVVK